MLVRPARPDDAAGIAAVHVAAWQGAYAGILPQAYLAGMSLMRQAAYYHARILAGPGVFVAAAPSVVGFATAGRPRTRGLGDGEIETLYVLDDWREQGVGRACCAPPRRTCTAPGAAAPSYGCCETTRAVGSMRAWAGGRR